MPDTATILMSAGVAATTTLLIEFTAKPRLEMRKERVLQRFRDKQTVLRQLDALSDRLVGILTESLISAQQPLTMVEEVAKEVRALSARKRVLIEHCSEAVFDLVEYELSTTATTLNMVGHMYQRGPSMSDDGNIPPGIVRAAHELLSTELGNFQLTATFLHLPRWRWIHRRRISRVAIQRRNSLMEEGPAEKSLRESIKNNDAHTNLE